MVLPLLVPRPRQTAAHGVLTPTQLVVPTPKEWAGLYSEIEQLYVCERRKLRYIMQYMEREHGFKATEQMYKKRFAKWGFQKNSRRLACVAPTGTKVERTRRLTSRRSRTPEELSSIPASPAFAHDEGLMLMVLNSVRICGMAFFEPMQSHKGFLESQQMPRATQLLPGKIDEVNYAFKLAMSLLDRGHGNLAGRVARKGFLLIEDLLTLEGPVLIWNLVEMMHHMVAVRHPQLFQMLLVHFTALIDGRLSKDHPLSVMLRGLRGLAASLAIVGPKPGSSVPSSSSSPSPSSSLSNGDGDEARSHTADQWMISYTLAHTLEQAWTLNAEIVFENFDPRLFALYCLMQWDSCSISPPPAIVSIADEWFSDLEAQQTSRLATEAHGGYENLLDVSSVATDKLLVRLLAPRIDSSPPQDFDSLYLNSMTALRKHRDFILAKGPDFAGDATILLNILAVLVTTIVLEQWPSVVVNVPCTLPTGGTTRLQRVHAGRVACALRTLMDIEPERRSEGFVTPTDVVERIRSIVALLEYAHTETDPRVVLEMWMLVDALVAAGHYKDAQEVERAAFGRLDEYVRHIPVHSV